MRGCEFCSKPFNRPTPEPLIRWYCPYCRKLWVRLPRAGVVWASQKIIRALGLH